VEPGAEFGRDRGQPGQVVDDAGVGGTRGRHHRRDRGWVAVGLDRCSRVRAGKPVPSGVHHQRIKLEQPQGVDDRRMHVGADQHAPARLRQVGSFRGEAPLGLLAGYRQGREVCCRPAGDEASAGRGRQAGLVGDQPEHLVLGVDSTSGFQPRDALNGRAGHQHVEEQRRLGRCRRDEAEEPRAVRRDHRRCQGRGINAEHLIGIVPFVTEQIGQRVVQSRGIA